MGLGLTCISLPWWLFFPPPKCCSMSRIYQLLSWPPGSERAWRVAACVCSPLFHHTPATRSRTSQFANQNGVPSAPCVPNRSTFQSQSSLRTVSCSVRAGRSSPTEWTRRFQNAVKLRTSSSEISLFELRGPSSLDVEVGA